MSFSSDIKTELLENLSKEKNVKYLNAEKYGENLTYALTKASLSSEFKEFLNISNLTENIIKNIFKGVFLNSGCIVDPNTDYHLEIVLKNKACAEYIFNLFSVLDFTPKLIKRKSTYVIYIKDSEQISIFLSLIEATNALLKYEEIRVEKNVKNNINRATNCETANLSKTVESATKQLMAIEKIYKAGKENLLNDKLKKTASLRKKYPYDSLDYISKQTINDEYISKSGLKHRLDKIIEIADNI